MTVDIKSAHDCIKAFSETDLTEDLAAIDVLPAGDLGIRRAVQTARNPPVTPTIGVKGGAQVTLGVVQP
jgi:hypothetical protein